jgi:hypothetical protein
MNVVPLLFTGVTAPAQAPTLALSEESPRILKRFGPSNLIVDQVPDFINRDHQTFRAFVEAYYEWMERVENPFGIIDGFMDLTDVDRSLGIFFDDFRETYLRNFPFQLATDSEGNVVNEANFLKNVREFYRAKGTEKAYKFLFRLLYNATAEVYHPSKDILRTSDGKWVEPISIKTTSNGGTGNYAIEGSQVYQVNSTSGDVVATAVVQRVVQYRKNYYDITEIYLKDLVGDFIPGNEVKSTTFGFLETVYPVVTQIDILSTGKDYSKTDPLVVVNTGNGIGLSVAIETINERGEIKSIKVIDSGIGYEEGKVSISSSTNSGDGNLSTKVVVGGVSRYPGFYSSNDGKLSSNKKIFDGNYYQQFSYVLKSEIAFKRYAETYKKLIHPAGFKMFGEVLLKRNIIDSLPFHSEFQRYEIPYIGHYTPYRMGTTADLYNKYINGFNPRGNTFSSYQSYGQTGGKLLITPIGFTFGSGVTWSILAASGSNNNLISADVFEFQKLGQTWGAFYLKQIDFDTTTASITGGGFVAGSTIFLVDSNAVGYTGTIERVSYGLGIVPETTSGQTHDPQGLPLGSSGSFEGYIEAQGFSYAYWEIYHHPNIRGMIGYNSIWSGGTGHGASFGDVNIYRFFKMPLGYHFHSNPAGTPYLGTTGVNNEYGLIEATSLASPNF